jgi:ribonucleoside-diphosphate reductase alpha chain
MRDLPEISKAIWDMKYRFAPEEGVGDLTMQDTWHRVAKALAQGNTNRQSAFFEEMNSGRFLPAGRIISGAGTGRRVTLVNCFVSGTIPDAMGGIFDRLKEAALTMQQGGGIGMDFSTLRPKGARVKGVGARASGPLPFMDTWDAMCRTIMSAGARRGAMMGVLRCDHPDIEAFIDAKRDRTRLRNFNVSVAVTDAFMLAVEEDAEWPLVFNGEVYKTVQAKALWDRIMRAAYDCAEPGVLFIDRINEGNNLRGIEEIAATNPCGEQPLGPYGACVLGSLNLARFIEHPFTGNKLISASQVRSSTRLAVQMLDAVNDVSGFPLPEQAAAAQANRRIGLGVTGVADALAMYGLTYGSKEAQSWLSEIMAAISEEAYSESERMATKRGHFPNFYPSVAADLSKAYAGKRSAPRRNSHLLSIAPTGTISLLAGNVSSGIEPIFALDYERKVTQADGSKVTELVEDYAVRLYRQMFPGQPLPAYFVTAQDLKPEAHLAMQAAAQRHVDSAVSKTINLPASISFEDFARVYTRAWRLGCKGCTAYRPNDVTGSVLSVTETAKEGAPAVGATDAAAEGDMPPSGPLSERPRVLSGKTYKLRFGAAPHASYITVTDMEKDGQRRPYEVFLSSKGVEHQAWTMALTRMISAVFRRGGDVSFVAEELTQIADPMGGAWMDGGYVPSEVAAIGRILKEHMGLAEPMPAPLPEAPSERTEAPSEQPGPACPACGGHNMRNESGCLTCPDCGYSKCA